MQHRREAGHSRALCRISLSRESRQASVRAPVRGAPNRSSVAWHERSCRRIFGDATWLAEAGIDPLPAVPLAETDHRDPDVDHVTYDLPTHAHVATRQRRPFAALTYPKLMRSAAV